MSYAPVQTHELIKWFDVTCVGYIIIIGPFERDRIDRALSSYDCALVRKQSGSRRT